MPIALPHVIFMVYNLSQNRLMVCSYTLRRNPCDEKSLPCNLKVMLVKHKFIRNSYAFQNNFHIFGYVVGYSALVELL